MMVGKMAIAFPRLIILFKREERIILYENELDIKSLKNEQKIKIENVIQVTYNTMPTMNVKFGVLTIELKDGKDIKIYFDIYMINGSIQRKHLNKDGID